MLSPNELGLILRREAKAQMHTQQEIADMLGVHQSQISRIFKGDFTRRSRHVMQICKFLKIDPDTGMARVGVVDNEYEARLFEALRDVWDGTRANGQVLEKLLRGLGELSKAK